jgi:hypothetical protein
VKLYLNRKKSGCAGGPGTKSKKQDPISKTTRAERAEGVAQAGCRILSSKPQYHHQKKKKKKKKLSF